jgi:chorismate mutase
MQVRGVRGATVVRADKPEEIISATKELLGAIMEANPELKKNNLASAIFTVTSDLNSAYPARAAREIGWDLVPLMCAQEIPVPGSLKKCVRVLLHWNTDKPLTDIHHVYLREAIRLRPDLIQDKQ